MGSQLLPNCEGLQAGSQAQSEGLLLLLFRQLMMRGLSTPIRVNYERISVQSRTIPSLSSSHIYYIYIYIYIIVFLLFWPIFKNFIENVENVYLDRKISAIDVI